MNINKESSFIVGVLAFGMLQIVSVYEAAGPDLQTLRELPPSSDEGRQKLLDADLMVGGAVFIVIAAASYATRSLLPLIMLGGAFVIVSGWHHMVSNGDTLFN